MAWTSATAPPLKMDPKYDDRLRTVMACEEAPNSLYGANISYRTGDDIYTFDPDTPQRAATQSKPASTATMSLRWTRVII